MSTNSANRKSESYTGHDVIDSDGQHLGQITDVIYDTTNETDPTWLVVKPGILRAEHYVPVEGSYTSDAGDLVIPFDKKWVIKAPKASGDHVVDHETESHLIEHYGEPQA